MKKNIFEGKTILITGASGDIGLACAELFAQEKATLVLQSHKRHSVIEDFIKRYPEIKIVHIKCDATNEKAVISQFKLIISELVKVKIDVLVNNAGDLLERRGIDDMNWDFVQKVIDVNIKSAFLFTKYSLPFMPHNSSILFISSLTARCGKGDRSSAYGLAKGGILSWSKCLANELGKRGIRVNSLTPGFIKGNFHDKYTSKGVEKEHAKRNPLGRVGTPVDVAEAVLFYAMTSRGYISGTTLDICGADYMN